MLHMFSIAMKEENSSRIQSAEQQPSHPNQLTVITINHCILHA